MQQTADYRSQFPILENGLYLNHAAIGPWPECAAQAVQEFATENCRHGPADYARWIQGERALRTALASLVNASGEDDIALLKNTTEGISTVAWGVDWQTGDRVVLPLGEFPSNDLPWRAQQAKGVSVDIVDIRSADDAEQALIDAIGPSTRVLSVSAVQWSDGFRLDLERLGEACRRKGVLFFVDAIQQLGALPVDVEACHIDALAADAHKWLLGPEGIALFYCRANLRERLSLVQQGWHMFDNPWNFQRSDRAPSSTARRFEAGSPNTLGQVALLASLESMQQLGAERIERRILQNTRQMIEEFAQHPGLELCSASDPVRQSGIVSVKPVDRPAGPLYRKLQEEGVSCALREGAVRLSPHFYQGEAEICRLLAILENILDRPAA